MTSNSKPKFYPAKPTSFHGSYAESKIFNLLESLAPRCQVYHSFKIVTDRMEHKEADFLIFDPQYGLLVIEVKGGSIKYSNGNWYQNEKPCTDPYDQACEVMFNLRRLVKRKLPAESIPVTSSVWFPDVSLSQKDKNSLPPDLNEFLVLDRDDASLPPAQLRKRIEGIFQEWEKRSQRNIKVNPSISDRIKQTLVPTLNLVQPLSQEPEGDVYFQLTNEQSKVLDFIQDEERVAIGGSAGSGKTLVAFEQAKRFALQGLKTLFLVYNKALKLYLSSNAPLPNLEISNWSSFVYKYARGKDPAETIQVFISKIESGMINLPYDVVIIDEGQDFEQDWIAALELSLPSNAKIYVYYDNKQTIQNSKNLPDWIRNSQVKLNLNRNCRNTVQIATTAHAFVDAKAKMIYEITGPKPKWIRSKQVADDLRAILISKIGSYPFHEIAIISLLGNNEAAATKANLIDFGREKGSTIFQDVSENHRENGKIILSTVRKFKGLEAEVVIITDLQFSDKEVTEDEIADLKKRIYTACSRAKKELYIISESMTESIFWDGKLYSKPEFEKYFKEQYHVSTND